MILSLVDAPPFRFGGGELFLVGLTSAIIFAILGPRLLRDLMGRDFMKRR